jgi:hypothetical protein
LRDLQFARRHFFAFLLDFLRLDFLPPENGQYENSDELRSLEFPRIPSTSSPEYFTLSTGAGATGSVDFTSLLGWLSREFDGFSFTGGATAGTTGSAFLPVKNSKNPPPRFVCRLL